MNIEEKLRIAQAELPFNETFPCASVISDLNRLFSKETRSKVRIVHLGCYQGHYSVEFAKNGYDTLGIEARQVNYDNCVIAQKKAGLPNLRFIKDDVRNIKEQGKFDVVFCSGLLYHLDTPCAFLKTMGEITNKLLILNTHFSLKKSFLYDSATLVKKILRRLKYKNNNKADWNLSKIAVNEGKIGRWYTEFTENDAKTVENNVWAAYGNNRSFWLEKNELINAVKEAGFSVVNESTDAFGKETEKYIYNMDRTIFNAFK